ncbi:hypothetical protein GGI12_004121 [Dipsacomyces acuminosporus]|nr:hypothetical protein GGI12_004121 [Dipsacomyces acuminosporus]
MKHRLSATKQQKKSDEEINRLIEEIRLGERKLMRYVNHYVLNYDDITAGDKPSSVATSKSHELGTISPPMSPSTAPNRPLPLPPQEQLAEGKVTDNDDASIIAPPHLTSRTLPPTPTSATPPIQEQQQEQKKKKKDEDDDDDKEAEGEVEGKKGDLAPAVVVAAAAADWTVIQAQTADNNNRATVMDSQAFITSYKQKAKPGNAGEYDIDSGESSNSNSIKFEAHRDRRKSKINWNGLFGSKNIRAQITNDETSSFSSISNSQPSESPNPSVLSGKK